MAANPYDQFGEVNPYDRFGETEGGAVAGIRREPVSRELQDAGAIAGATALGGAMGAMAPEVLRAGARVSGAFPITAPLASALDAAAAGARTAGRGLTSVGGALSGFMSETAGQGAEAFGANKVEAEIARIVGGGIGPEMATPIRVGVEAYLKTPSLSFTKKIQKEVLRPIWQKFTQAPESIDEREKRILVEAINEVRGGIKSDAPQTGVYDILKNRAQSRIAAGADEAAGILSDAERAINVETMGAMKGPVSYMRSAQERIKARGQDAIATAQLQRQNVGQDVDPSDVGSALRGVVVKRNESALAQREAQFKADEVARDAIVQSKESQRQFVNSTPQYQSLITDLESQIKPGVRSPDVAKNFQNILNQIRNPEKDIFGQHKPISFQVLDDVRRKLGEAFRGTPPEGYEAIGKQAAMKYYGIISNIQKQYAGGAGGPQERLLQHYANATEGMEMFRSKLGRAATELDKFDDNLFKTDPSALPKTYFATKTKVQELIKLAGDRAPVVNAAKDFAATELRDKTAQQVRSWMTQKRELLSALPEVRSEIMRYEQALTRGEAIARHADQAVTRLETRQGDVMRDAERRGTSMRAGAERQAAEARGIAEKESSILMGKDYPVERVKNLIESGNPEQWKLAAPAILAAPGGKQKLVESVRQVLANRASKSTTGLTEYFSTNIKPALEATNMMTPQQTGDLASKLASVENLKIPEEQKIGIWRRMILQSIGGYAASIGGRTGAATHSSLVDLIPR